MIGSNDNKTLTELGVEIPEVDIKSSLVSRCQVAVAKTIDQLSSEDMRLLITQSLGLQILIPKALDLLEEDVLASAGLFKGDLLLCVTQVPKSFWKKNIELNNRMMEIKIEVDEISETLNNEIIPSFDSHEFL